MENSIDKLMLFSVSNRKNNTYNYEKIAKNIVQLNVMLGLHLTETECKGVQAKISQFVDAKTKGQSVESKIKKSIRKKIQDANIRIEECKDSNLKKTYEIELKKVSELIF